MKLPESFEETAALLKQFEALKEGHFLLASGRHSGHYIQKARLVEQPKVISELIQAKREALDALGKIDTVFSPAMGGVPVGQQVGLELEARHIYAERDNANEMVLKRGFEVKEGERVLLVEDVITTGGTLVELRDFVEGQGAEIAGVYVVVNRSGLTDWQGLPLVSSLEITFPTYAPDEVPEELAAIEMVRPGTKKIQ